MLGANQNQACAFGQLFFAIVVEIQTAPLQNDSEGWLSDKTRACPPGEGDEGPSALAFSECRPFSFRKPISMVACFIDLLVNSKACNPRNSVWRDRAESESLAAFPGIEFMLSMRSDKLKLG